MAKKSEDKPEKTTAKATASVTKKEVVTPLRVEITFPSITDLKQALAFDGEGNLIIKVMFTSRVDQYEIFRLVNLLKQPHGALFATIGTPQSAMDFKFTKDGRVEIVKAQIAAEKKPDGKGDITLMGKPDGQGSGKPEPVTILEIAFNHIPEEERPYGVVIDFVQNGTGEKHTVAGRGKSATEAVIAGVKATRGFPEDMKEPFELIEALKKTKETPALIKIVRAIEVGSFDIDEGGKKEGEEEPKGD